MEIKYRAGDNAPTPMPTPTPKQSSFPPPLPPPRHEPISTITFFTDQPLRGGFSGMVPGPAPGPFRIPASNAGGGVFVGEAVWREMEKARIRREIIAGEVARRIQLEEEVRRELGLDRGWVVPMPRNLNFDDAAATANGFPFNERVAIPVDRNPAGVSHYDVPRPQLPQLMAPPEIVEPPAETNKDKVIVLAKPNPDLFAAKRKAVTPPVVDGSEQSPRPRKKPKSEWSCALCKVSATCESGLNDHLKGRKHKAKEASLRTQKIDKSTSASSSSKKGKKFVKSVKKFTEPIVTAVTPGFDAKADRQPLQPLPGITGGALDLTTVDKGVVESKNEAQLVQNFNSIEDLKNEAVANGDESRRMNAPKATKFWCEVCQVGAHSLVVMTNHKKGRRHLKRMDSDKLSPVSAAKESA